jgi:hypothetical protein
MPAMTDFTFNFLPGDASDAVQDKLDLYISTDNGANWQFLGPFDDESNFDAMRELFEYDNDGQPYISNFTKEKFQIKGSLLNTSNIYARAIAYGRDPSDVDTSDPVYNELDLSTLRPVPPHFMLRAIGQNQAGKNFMHEFCRAQVVTTQTTESMSKTDLAKLPIEFTAFPDPALVPAAGYKMYRYRVEK